MSDKPKIPEIPEIKQSLTLKGLIDGFRARKTNVPRFSEYDRGIRDCVMLAETHKEALERGMRGKFRELKFYINPTGDGRLIAGMPDNPLYSKIRWGATQFDRDQLRHDIKSDLKKYGITAVFEDSDE